MRGHIRERGVPGSLEYIVDIDMAAAQRCQSCNRRHWTERRPKECQVGIRPKVVSERLQPVGEEPLRGRRGLPATGLDNVSPLHLSAPCRPFLTSAAAKPTRNLA